MICTKCTNKSICKIFDTFVNASEVEIEIKACEHFRQKLIGMPIITKTETINLFDDISEKTESIRESRSLNDVTALSNKIRLEEEAKQKGITPVEILESDLMECPNCKDKVIMTIACQKCNKEICPTCAGVDLSNMSLIACEECINKDDIIDKKPNKKTKKNNKEDK